MATPSLSIGCHQTTTIGAAVLTILTTQCDGGASVECNTSLESRGPKANRRCQARSLCPIWHGERFCLTRYSSLTKLASKARSNRYFTAFQARTQPLVFHRPEALHAKRSSRCRVQIPTRPHARVYHSSVPSITPRCRSRSGFIPAKLARFRAFSASS